MAAERLHCFFVLMSTNWLQVLIFQEYNVAVTFIFLAILWHAHRSNTICTFARSSFFLPLGNECGSLATKVQNLQWGGGGRPCLTTLAAKSE